MNFLNVNYGLHDALVTKISFLHNEVVFEFKNGVYFLDANGKELKLTPFCQMLVRLVDGQLWQHIVIERRYKKKLCVLNFFEFEQLLKTDDFDIEDDYYSSFSKSMMLTGFVGKYQVNFIISEIKDVEFTFLDEQIEKH